MEGGMGDNGLNVQLEIGRDVLDKAIEDRLSEMVRVKGESGFTDATQELSKQERVNTAYQVWRNDGFLRQEDGEWFEDPDARQLAKIKYKTLCDAFSTADAPILMPKVLVRVVKEALEPILTLTPLFRTIRFSAGSTITFPAVGAIHAADIAEGEEYPEQKVDIGGGHIVATVGKSGLKCRFTDEMLRYSQYDMMSMHLEAAGRALARHKEQKVANQISDLAAVSMDGDGGTATHGLPSGRDIHGNGNNTITIDDLLVQYADLVNDGFLPRALLMNPMGWLIFARDPTLRAFGFANGGPLFGTFPPNGSAQNSSVWSNGPNMAVPFGTLPNRQTTWSAVPSLFPAPLRIIVSPFITYDSANSKTDIYMCDPDELGAIIVDEDVTTEQWDDPNRDIRAVKFRERYTLQVLNEGKGVTVLKNISTARGYDFEDRMVWDAATVSLPGIP